MKTALRIVIVVLFTLPWWIIPFVMTTTGTPLYETVTLVSASWLILSPVVFCIVALGVYRFGYDDGVSRWYKDPVHSAVGG